jgi:uncharacterized repeat protein (TIGR01451 family)
VGTDAVVVSSTVGHGAVSAGADGTIPPTLLTLPALGTGPYDVTVPDGGARVFPLAYRVYAPRIEVSKRATPALGAPTTVVTYTLSFTNTGREGDPRAAGFALHDTLPPEMTYVSGSAASDPAAVIGWYSATCFCYAPSEPAPSDVLRLLWRFPPLPAGASGSATFQVTVQP